MKILQLTQKNLAAVGVSQNLLLQPNPFNARIWLGFLILGLYFICNVVYIFFGAKTFADHTQSICRSSFAVFIILSLAIIVFNVKKLFQLIDTGERVINTSEFTRSINSPHLFQNLSNFFKKNFKTHIQFQR